MIHIKVINNHFCTVYPPATLTPGDMRGLIWQQRPKSTAAERQARTHREGELDHLNYALTKQDQGA